jgi:hypothetical protein
MFNLHLAEIMTIRQQFPIHVLMLINLILYAGRQKGLYCEQCKGGREERRTEGITERVCTRYMFFWTDGVRPFPFVAGLSRLIDLCGQKWVPVATLRMRAAGSPLPSIFMSWRLIKHKGNFCICHRY